MKRIHVLILVCAVLLLAGCAGRSENTAQSAAGGNDMQTEYPDLTGAWEPENYIGPRVEITGDRLIRLWNSSPVLETTYRMERSGDRIVLVLEDTALCYSGSDTPYATVKECWYEDGAITVVDNFPITGESTDVLYPTENSRYGNVDDVSDQVLPQLQGKWKALDSDWNLSFEGNTMHYGYGEEQIHQVEVVVVKDRSSGEMRITLRQTAKEPIIRISSR